MEKRVKRISLIVDIIVYILLFVIGYTFLIVNNINMISFMPIAVYSVFFVFGFLLLIAYLVISKKDKEKKNFYLMFSMINVLLAGAIVISLKGSYECYEQFTEIVLLYTIFIAMEDYIELKKLKDINFYVKASFAVVCIILGILFALIIFDTKALSMYLMAYYFIAISLFKLLECCFIILINGPTFQSKYNKPVIVKRNKIAIKELKKRKPVTKLKQKKTSNELM